MHFHRNLSHSEMVKLLMALEKSLGGVVGRIKANKESVQDVLNLKAYDINTIGDLEFIRDFLKYNYKDGKFLPEKGAK